MMSFFRRRLWLVILLPVLLAASDECTESGINQDIKDVLGLDTDSPFQVAIGVGLGKKFGNDDERNAAEMGSTLKDFRRADHEEKGDRAKSDGNYVAAANEYEKALQWIDDPPKPSQLLKQHNLQVSLANAQEDQAARLGVGDESRKLYLKAAGNYGKSALTASDPGTQALDYDLQAGSYISAGAYDKACGAARRSGDQSAALKAALRVKGFVCE